MVPSPQYHQPIIVTCIKSALQPEPDQTKPDTIKSQVELYRLLHNLLFPQKLSDLPS